MTARSEENQKYLPSQLPGHFRLKLIIENISAPVKPTPPRPAGPEHLRFKRDVVTRIWSCFRTDDGKFFVHARKRLTALTRRYSPTAASGLDGLTPTAQRGSLNGFKLVWLNRVKGWIGRTYQSVTAYTGHDATHSQRSFPLQLASPCRCAA